MGSLLKWSIVSLLPLGACIGCKASNKDMLQFLREHEHEVSAIEYRVGIPDSIGISAPRIPEIDQEAQVIQPDGKITLRLLGEVKVVGMTSKEIAAKLEVLLSRYYVDPKVSVRITAYESKKFYVFGQVNSPGPRAYTGHDTLIDAVMESGVNFLSWTSQTKVIRPSHENEEGTVLHVDVNRMIKKGDWSGNVLLEPDDVVYVPATPLGWAGLRVRELLWPVQPAYQAYQIPAQVKATQEVYADDDNDDNSRRRIVIGR